MHSFRTGTDAWFSHLGPESSGHGPQEPIDIQFVDSDHPITKTSHGLDHDRRRVVQQRQSPRRSPARHWHAKTRWATIRVLKKRLSPGRTRHRVPAASAPPSDTTRKRSKTLAISNSSRRGLLWSCGKLNNRYLTPYQGENETTFIDKEKYQIPEATDLGEIRADALRGEDDRFEHPKAAIPPTMWLTAKQKTRFLCRWRQLSTVVAVRV